MVTTYAQAQEIAEDWINAGVPRSRCREVRVREFDLGFVCWAVDPDGTPEADRSELRLVIARESGASTLWPPMPVNEVVRQYEELYGSRTEANPAGAAKPVPGAVEATSFLLSPPQWLQDAGAAAIAAEAAKLGPADDAEPAGDEPEPAGAAAAASASGGIDGVHGLGTADGTGTAGVPGVAEGADGLGMSGGGDHGGRADASAGRGAAASPVPAPLVFTTPPESGRPAGDAPTMLAPPSSPYADESPVSPPPPPPLNDPAAETVRLPEPVASTDGAGLPTAEELPAAPGLPVAQPLLFGPTPTPGGPTPPQSVPGMPGFPGAGTPPHGMPPVPPAPGVPEGGFPAAPLPGAGQPGFPGTPPHGMPPVPPAPGVPGAGFPGVPPQGVPGMPPGVGQPGFPGTPPHGMPPVPPAPGVPGAGFPGVPPQGVPGVPGPGFPAAPLPGVGQPGFPGTPPHGVPPGPPAPDFPGAPPQGGPGFPGAGALPVAPASDLPGASPQGIAYAPTMLASDGPPGLMGLPGAPGMPPGPGGAGRSAPTGPPPPPPNDLLGGSGSAASGHGGRATPTAPPPPPPADLLPQAGVPPHAAAGRGEPAAPPPPPPNELRGPGDAAAPAAPPSAPNAEAAAVAYQPTQLAPAVGLPGAPPDGGQGRPQPPAGYGYPAPGAPGGVIPSSPPPGAPIPPGGMPPGAVPSAPVPPGAPGPIPPGGMPPGAVPSAPVPPGVPAVGPGTQAVVSYRGPDGSEKTLVHRSEPGTPHPEWKALHELRSLNVPADQVIELHTDLELCDLPGGYCARMVKASWPNVRISHTVPYGREQQARQSGMGMLLDHLDQLHQLAAAPQRTRPFRAPLPPPGAVQQLPPAPPQQLAAELGQAFGPSVFRFEQRAVSRQGVPPQVAETLMWAGLPRDFAPFFWAQAQEGRPIPTLAELAAERGRPAAPDFGGYLVLGNDYGRQLCVQYGTAAVVAVDLEGGGEAPRFVNSGVPEFVRSLAMAGRMWRLRYGLTPDQAGRWTTDFQAQLLAIDPAALLTPESWWGVLVEQFWDGLL